MEKQKKAIFWAIIVSETSHIFCCVLPVLFSFASLFAGLGMISALPAGYVAFHDFMHRWEVPMIAVSAMILVFGWWLYFHSQKVDCHDTGCHHPPCTPQKDKTNLILKIATALFIFNVAVYLVFHRGMGVMMPHAQHETEITHSGF